MLVVFSVDSSSLSISYLGPNGTYSYSALREAFPLAIAVPFSSIAEVVDSVFNSSVNLGVIPLANSRTGEIKDTRKALDRYNVKIITEIKLPIVHCLGALSNHLGIRTIISKDNVLEQCEEYLNKNYPNAERIFISSSAAAAREVYENDLIYCAAIASKESIRENSLEIIARDLVPGNYSIFVVIARE